MTGFDRKRHPKMKPRSYKTVKTLPLLVASQFGWRGCLGQIGVARTGWWRLFGKDGRLQQGLGGGSGCGEELKTPGNGLKAEELLGSSNSEFLLVNVTGICRGKPPPYLLWWFHYLGQHILAKLFFLSPRINLCLLVTSHRLGPVVHHFLGVM